MVCTSSVTAILKTLGLEPLAERRAKARIIMMYIIVHGIVDILASDHIIQAPAMPSSAYHTRRLWHTSAESSPTARACGTPSQMRLQKQKASTPLRNGSPTSRPMLRSLPQHPVNSHFYAYMHLFPGVVDTFSHTHTVRDTLIGSCTISEEEELTAPAISRPWLKPNEYYRGGDYI